MSEPPTDSITIALAGIPVTVFLDRVDAATRAKIVEHYAAFTLSPRPARLVVHVQTEAGSPFIPFEGYSTWQVHTTNSNGMVSFQSHLEQGWADLNRGDARLLMRPAGEPENFLRVVYAWLCLANRALLVHACGVIRRGRGYVFFGPSGSGKTTIAGLSADATVLSDDLAIIRKEMGVYSVHGVPFRGDLPEAPRANAAAPLDGLFTLVKDTRHALTASPPFEAVARLASCVPFVMSQPANAAMVVELCSDLVGQVPVRALHFRRDPGFWEVIDAG